MRASRLLTILMRLQLRGRISAVDLARDLEVSVRTIYRDVDQLSAAGVPIFSERGRNGGFELHEGYRTNLTGLTESEAEALLLAGIGAAAADLGIGEAAATARLKMLASLPPALGASALRVGTRFHLDPAAWYSQGQAPESLPLLASAVWNDLCVRFTYQSWKGEVSRRAEPWGLVTKGGAWYLVAAVDGVPRTYRVSSIRDLEVLEATFERSTKFDLKTYWSSWIDDFEARLFVEQAVVQLSPIGLRRLQEVSPKAAAGAAISARPVNESGWIEAEIPIESIEFSAQQLLRLGREIIVLSPVALRRALALQVRTIASYYVAEVDEAGALTSAQPMT